MARKRISRRGNRGPEFLSVARSLFFKRGYNGTTIEKVAERAGFSKRTVYLYFKNKDELFVSVAVEGVEIFRDRLKSVEAEGMTFQQAMDGMLRVYFEFAEEHPDYFRIIFKDLTHQMIENVSEELKSRMLALELECLQFALDVVDKGTLPEAVDPLDVAIVFWTAFTGILLLADGGSQTVFTRKTREAMLEKATMIIYRGLGVSVPAQRTLAAL